MAEKRFVYMNLLETEAISVSDDECYYFNEYGSVEKVCDLLNELNDECEFLEIENEALEDGATKYAELYHKSLKENEQLKEFAQHNYSESKKIISNLQKENEQLKQFKDTTFVLINEMIETANLYRTPIKSLHYGDNLGYWNGVYQKLKELKEILFEKGDVE